MLKKYINNLLKKTIDLYIYNAWYKYFRSGTIYVQNWRVREVLKCILAYIRYWIHKIGQRQQIQRFKEGLFLHSVRTTELYVVSSQKQVVFYLSLLHLSKGTLILSCVIDFVQTNIKYVCTDSCSILFTTKQSACVLYVILSDNT